MLVREIMTTHPVCCLPADSMQHVARLMREHQVGALPVVESQNHRRLLGIVTDRDLCTRLVADGLDGSTPISRAMTPNPFTCIANDSVATCENLMQSNAVRRIPVVNDVGVCIGIVAQADLALHGKAQNLQRMLREISRPNGGAKTRPTRLSA